MIFQKFLRAFLLIYNWDKHVDASREEIIRFFNGKFKSNSAVIGHSTWKTIYFMCPIIGGTIYNYSLIGFKGVIAENQHDSTIHLKARFVQPFLFFYIIPALLFPILYIFDIYGMRDNLNWLNNDFLNVITPPTLIWSAVMIYYQFKLMIAKGFIKKALKELQIKTHYNINYE
ncbi:hypothetical protein QYS49_38780 [Marivirga salinae]|uniref:Uncharacterized protein n=1 Tax=Marivirga salinarum TaxID=3059078 RepID=A0AA51NA01_9BACT|nr:hypothetical protein [Marivirga sp. BDSF4-3]WMN11542.1 hypothetical protein QYS49_38780 [Marivirga sp. BDSF4-3]